MSRQWQFWQFVSLFQGVMRIRKRVTLMVLIVSLVFAVCWLTDASNFILSDFSVVRTSLPIALTNTLILFNSAINPIVYALVNQRFRRKFKSMICCFSRRTRNKVNPTFRSTNPTLTWLIKTLVPLKIEKGTGPSELVSQGFWNCYWGDQKNIGQ